MEFDLRLLRQACYFLNNLFSALEPPSTARPSFSPCQAASKSSKDWLLVSTTIGFSLKIRACTSCNPGKPLRCCALIEVHVRFRRDRRTTSAMLVPKNGKQRTKFNAFDARTFSKGISSPASVWSLQFEYRRMQRHVILACATQLADQTLESTEFWKVFSLSPTDS